MGERIKGGLADNMTLEDIAKKHDVDVNDLRKQLIKGIKVEMEHTNCPKEAKEIAYDHLFESPTYYDGLEKMEDELVQKGEETEQTMSSSSGAYVGPMSSPVKKPINTIHNSETKGEFKEATTTSVSANGQYDVPFGGKGRTTQEQALSIEGPSSIDKRGKAINDKFPSTKFGGPEGVFIKIKDKCKKFPYCNEGDINAIEVVNESITEVSEKFGIPREDIEKIVLKEIRDIFMLYETNGNK